MSAGTPRSRAAWEHRFDGRNAAAHAAPAPQPPLAVLRVRACRLRRQGLISPHDAPSPPHLTRLVERVRAGAAWLPPRSIAQALHACAALRHAPPPACLHALLDQGLARRAGEWRAPQASAALWALGALRAPPPAPALRAALRRLEEDVRALGSGGALAGALWALGALGHAPPRAWMEHYLWQVRGATGGAGTGGGVAGGSQLVGRLAVCGIACDLWRLICFLNVMLNTRSASPGRGVHGTAVCSPCPTHRLALSCILADLQVQRRAGACDARALALVLAALARLQYRPPRAWAAAVLRAARQRMFASPASPAGGQEEQAGTQQQQQQQQAQAHEGPGLLFGAAQPGQQRLAGDDGEAGALEGARRGGGASPHTLAMFLWALARLQLVPRAGYLRRVLTGAGGEVPRRGGCASTLLESTELMAISLQSVLTAQGPAPRLNAEQPFVPSRVAI